MRLLINIDVPDLERAIGFYEQAFGLTLTRRLGPAVAEMSGAQAPIYLLEKAADTRGGGRDAPAAGLRPALDAGAPGRGGGRRGRGRDAGRRGRRPARRPGRHACLGPHRPPERPVRPWHLPAAVPGPGLRRTGRTGAALPGRVEADFEDLLALRIAAMRESLERLGRFDPERARSRRAPPSARNTPGQSSWKENASASTRCARTATACAWTTCTCTRRPRPGAWAATLRRLLAQADAQGLPLRVGACAAATRTASTSATASSRSKKANGTSNTCAPRRRGQGLTPPSRATAALPPRNAAPPSATDRAK